LLRVQIVVQLIDVINILSFFFPLAIISHHQAYDEKQEAGLEFFISNAKGKRKNIFQIPTKAQDFPEKI